MTVFQKKKFHCKKRQYFRRKNFIPIRQHLRLCKYINTFKFFFNYKISIPKLSTSLFCFAKSTTCGPMRKWSSISMASSWMEGKCSTPVGLPRAILGVPGLPNGKGPEGRGDTNVEIILTFQGKVPTLTARLLNFFFF